MHLVALDGARNLRHHCLNIRQVGGSAIALRGAHGDEDGLALFNGLSQMRGEHHLVATVLCQQLWQMLLKDGHAALAELLHTGFVVVDADDLVTHFRKTGRRHKPYIARPDHTDRNLLGHAFVRSPLRHSWRRVRGGAEFPFGCMLQNRRLRSHTSHSPAHPILYTCRSCIRFTPLLPHPQSHHRLHPLRRPCRPSSWPCRSCRSIRP